MWAPRTVSRWWGRMARTAGRGRIVHRSRYERTNTPLHHRGKRGFFWNRDDDAKNGGGSNPQGFESTTDAFDADSGSNGSSNALVGLGEGPPIPTLIALPISRRPLIPGTHYPLTITDEALIAHVEDLMAKNSPYVGTFMRKDAQDEESPSPNSNAAASSDAAGAAGADSGLGEGNDGLGGGKSSSRRSSPTYMDMVKPIYSLEDVHDVGTFAHIMNVSKPDPYSMQLILHGQRRVRADAIVNKYPALKVQVEHHFDRPADKRADAVKAYSNEMMATIKRILQHNSVFKEQLQMLLHSTDLSDPSRLADISASLTSADPAELQEVLAAFDLEKRMGLSYELLKKELAISKLQAEISRKVEEKVSENQRKFLLHEQLKSIKRELGLEKDDKEALSSKFREQMGKKDIPSEALKIIEEELEKINSLESATSEFNMTRNYLDWLTMLPWNVYSEENFDIRLAQETLNRDHYGLEDVKDRILEFIAVGKLLGAVPQGKIVCLVGPPGVGKTSIGQSIADALQRKFYRFSVGGMFDVAEIKGHRRTYVGAMPGKLVQCLKTTQAANPVIMIDEIDKIGQGMRGDPSSALLEVLDPSQNQSFMDHYLDVPLDLSHVLFICTANTTDSIPGPLADRMEFIRLSGYISQEKLEIARSYLSPQALKETGLTSDDIVVEDEALLSLIRWYCREAGVRNLQKHIQKIYRKAALKIAQRVEETERKEGKSKDSESAEMVDASVEASVEAVVDESVSSKVNEEQQTPNIGYLHSLFQSESESSQAEKIKQNESEIVVDAVAEPNQDTADVANILSDSTSGAPQRPVSGGPQLVVTAENLYDYVGKPVFTSDKLYNRTPVGVVMGLAWNQMGGATLYIETTVSDIHSEPTLAVQTDEAKDNTPEGAEEASGANGALPTSRGLLTTGQLGDVMRESSQIAYTVAKAVLRRRHPENRFFYDHSLHMHVPEGATPKDGPSAGITMVTSLLSVALEKHVKPDLAMTGEITLTGRVLPIGGVKEKTISARRELCTDIVFPAANRKDFEELPEMVREGLSVHFVETYDEVYEIAFGYDKKAQVAGEVSGKPQVAEQAGQRQAL